MHFVSFVIAVAIIGVDAQRVGSKDAPGDLEGPGFHLQNKNSEVLTENTKVLDSGDESGDDDLDAAVEEATKKLKWTGTMKAKAKADWQAAEKETEEAEAALKEKVNKEGVEKAAAKYRAAIEKALRCKMQVEKAEDAETSTRDEVDRLAKLQHRTDVSRRATAAMYAKADAKASRASAQVVETGYIGGNTRSAHHPNKQGPKVQDDTAM